MDVIRGNNVNDIFIDGLWRLKVSGVVEDSRNGKVITLPNPAMTVYEYPMERVLFHPERNANPFFHLMESLWMLAGRDDVGFLTHYNKKMRDFSDDGDKFNGAYGFRWREHFRTDQIYEAIKMLRHDPTSRRIVIGMWDPGYDLGHPSADIPCNTHIYFRSVGQRLDMTVCCRSNDLMWGAYGANAVHFSILHELMARSAGMDQGFMYQLSNNLHIYEHHWHMLDRPMGDPSPYERINTLVVPLFEDKEDWTLFLEDCENIEEGNFNTTFFCSIVAHVMKAWDYYRAKDFNAALDSTAKMPLCDWRIAMESWLLRKAPKGEHDVPESK